MESLQHQEDEKRLITPEERDELQKVLGSMGLYNAAFDNYPIEEHLDEHWAGRGSE